MDLGTMQGTVPNVETGIRTGMAEVMLRRVVDVAVQVGILSCLSPIANRRMESVGVSGLVMVGNGKTPIQH